MAMVALRGARSRLIVISLGAAMGVAAGVLIAVLMGLSVFDRGGATTQVESSRGLPPSSGLGGSGGGVGNPSSELFAAFDSLPLYPGAAAENAVPQAYEGTTVWQRYFVPADAEQIMAFFDRELGIRGWQPGSVREEALPQKDGGPASTASERVSRSFTHGDLQVTITAAPNFKAPERGATVLTVSLSYR